MTQRRKTLGKRGEDAACKYLSRKGYKIVEKNYRCKLGEIDIVARQGEELVFVEVRTCKEVNAELAEESIGKRKQKKLQDVASYYLAQKNLNVPCRFDVVTINADEKGNPSGIRLYSGAF